MQRPGLQDLPAAAASRRRIRVYDRRSEGRTNQPKVLDATGLDINDFHRLLHREFSINGNELYELVTTDRINVDYDKFNEVKDGSTLYLVRDTHQQLPGATEESISFTPHFHTLTEAGTYEYHASEGNKALPYAIAELIDNALSATSKNEGMRTIEIRMMFDATLGKPALIVLDNGCGMTSKKLNNWAVYKLSKFSREDGTFSSQQEHYVRPDPVPRSLNSDISYFGVGGKQAIFFIGKSVRMITKSRQSPDIHELVLSEERFRKKEENNEDIFSGSIRNRAPGESSDEDEIFLKNLIAEEPGKESFTAVVISDLHPDHIDFMKKEFDVLTRQLAHVYHYYIHGPKGNDLHSQSTSSDQHNKLEIQVTLREKPPKLPHKINLREVDDDMQTLYNSSAKATFEFQASAGDAKLEGLIRYHPFLFDHETYPQDPSAEKALTANEDDLDDQFGFQHRARKKAIFECFWNGRLIPSTTVSEFEWCSWSSKRSDGPPAECYNRLSGVLFTDDGFRVTQNKLTFMDLELKLKDEETIFTIVSHGQNKSRRGNIQKEFNEWLLNCHELYDKQVKFMGFKGTVEQFNKKKKMMDHWTTFAAIEWDGKVFKAGQLVKSFRTQPIFYGTVVNFSLHGKYKQDVFGAGGCVKITHEPKVLYGEEKVISISKIDRDATIEAINKNINTHLLRLPKELKVEWPHGDPWPDNAVRSAGAILGPFNINIRNGKGESMSVITSGPQGNTLRNTMSVKFSLLHPGPGKKTTDYIAQHRAKGNQGFWFNEMEMVEIGKYTLSLNAITGENSTSFGDQALPSFVLRFTITAGTAESFVVDKFNPSVRVGMPFVIPLQITDCCGNATEPLFQPQPELTCSGWKMSYTSVNSNGSKVTLHGVKAIGKIPNDQPMENIELRVTLPGLKENTQMIKINLRPGLPHSIDVTPKEDPIRVDNGTSVTFNVEVHDEAGNATANPRQTVHCQVPGVRPQTIDCSRSGTGQLVTNPINKKIIDGKPQTLQVSFVMPNQKAVKTVTRELLVLPSTRVTTIKLYAQDDENLELNYDKKIEWLAGGVLDKLCYKLFDEAEREVVLTSEIVSKITVNWTDDVKMEDLVQGKLPDVIVPKQVQEKRFCQVLYQEDSVLSFSFTIVPHPDEPTKLKVTLPQSTVKLGETLSGNISLELVDKYDNPTKLLTETCLNQMNVEAEGLDKSEINFAWQGSSGSVAVTGVRFNAGTPGPREMSFTYQSYEEHVMVKVTAGVPTKLTLLSTPGQPLQFLNGTGSDMPFVVQLCDEWNNPSNDQTVEVTFTSSPPGLTVTTSVATHHVNAEGKAIFTLDSVSGPKGCYQLSFQGSFNNRVIPGPSVDLTVIPDPRKPVKLLVEYDKNVEFPAGGFFPVFSVTVVSDEGSPITIFKPADVSMLLWKSETSGETPPEDATVMTCSKPLENDRKDRFYFRDKEIPTLLGRHIIQFSLRVNNGESLFSEEICVQVASGPPVKLAPASPPSPPVVASSEDIAQRTLVENMNLTIMDSHGNPAGQGLNGRVVVSIIRAREAANQSIPLFEGSTNRVYFKLVEGKANIPRLAIMKNSPGENGRSYVLIFQPEVVSVSLASFRLHFHFYSDAQNQQMMSELINRKSELKTVLDTYNEYLSNFTELIDMLTTVSRDANQRLTGFEAQVRDELKRENITLPRHVSLAIIDAVISEKSAEAEIIQRRRRTCSIADPFKGQQDVLGKVGHLACIQDDDAARVISWYLGGSMDCVVTRTVETAQRIHRDTRGQQQVWPLESMNTTRVNRLLPHIQRGRALFDPPGNPVFARELLIYPQHEESCKIVFQSLLRDTILIDDLDSANQYRRKIVQYKIQCPNIVTRQGDKINALGIFGGAQNRAPPMERLKLFAAPFSDAYRSLEELKELLTRYRSAWLKKEEAEKELKEHLEKRDEYEGKKQEMEEKQRELEKIERQLASLQANPARRSLQDAPESSGIAAKRARM